MTDEPQRAGGLCVKLKSLPHLLLSRLYVSCKQIAASGAPFAIVETGKVVIFACKRL